MKRFEHDTTKTSRTFYTEEKIRIVKKNIEKFEWARKEMEATIKTAEEYLSYGVDKLMTYITQQNIPRSYGVNQIKGCPVCGKGIDQYSNYPYLADPLNKPFKLQCPNCKSVFPSNDFDSYYKSGLDENGRFHYEKADPKYLVNELYPDKPADWCVDNGFGWVDQEGLKDKPVTRALIGENRYTFIAYFNHWFIWLHEFGGIKEKRMVTQPIAVFRDAYIYTEDLKYAKVGMLLLNRVADFYKEFDAGAYKWVDNFRNSSGGGDWGKIIGSIWEETIVDNLIKAYDAFFPAISEDVLHEIKSHPYYKNNPDAPETIEDIKLNIENNILYQILPEVINNNIRGNFGMHQASIALSALVLQNEEYFNHSIDAIMATTDNLPDGVGNIDYILVNEIDHDGCGNEVAPGYNGIWVNSLDLVAQILEGTSRDLYKNERFKKMFDMEMPYFIADRYTLNIGDAGSAGNPFTLVYKNPHISLFLHNKDVKSARLLDLAARVQKEKGGDGTLVQNIFTDCEQLEKELKMAVEKYGPFKTYSENYSGYGISKIELRDESSEPKAVWMYYGRNTGHGHFDTLMLGLHGYGVFLNPDHGYPCFADRNYERLCWTENTISHDTVMVDQRPGKRHIVGIPHHFDGNHHVSVMDVEAPLIYKQTSMFRRTAVTVHLEGSTYVADFFRVQGGSDHRYVFHGAEGTVQSTGLNLIPQQKGTYAGEDVEFASEEYNKNHLTGYNYLYEVQRDDHCEGTFTVDWKIKDTFKAWKKDRNVHIAITVLDHTHKAALAKGMPPQNNSVNPKDYTYLIVHNEGENLESQFTSVIEPYEDQNAVIKVESLPLACKDNTEPGNLAKALKITLRSGRVDYILNAIDDRTYQTENGIEFKGFLGVISEKDGAVIYQYANDLSYLKFKGQELLSEELFVIGSVVDFTKEISAENKIIVRLDREICPSKLIGTYTDIETDLIRNGCYKILSADKNQDHSYTLHIGDITLIRGSVDDANPNDQYVYNIKEGAKLRIPLSVEK